MPWWPIMMPSEAVGAPKICGTPPPARTPSTALRTSRSRWALHGVISLKRFATPIIGLSKSSSRKPTARSMARLGARPGPPVVRRLFRLESDGMGAVSVERSDGHVGVEMQLTYLGIHGWQSLAPPDAVFRKWLYQQRGPP